MKKLLNTLVLFAMVAALCVGCQKEETPAADAENAAKKAVEGAKNWEPDTLKPKADADDHSGHNHAPGEHGH